MGAYSLGLSKFIRASTCRTHCAVIFAITRLSCSVRYTSIVLQRLYQGNSVSARLAMLANWSCNCCARLYEYDIHVRDPWSFLTLDLCTTVPTTNTVFHGPLSFCHWKAVKNFHNNIISRTATNRKISNTSHDTTFKWKINNISCSTPKIRSCTDDWKSTAQSKRIASVMRSVAYSLCTDGRIVWQLLLC